MGRDRVSSGVDPGVGADRDPHCPLQLQREDILRVIGSGQEHLPLYEVRRVLRHLARQEHVSALADRLERALKHARDWHEVDIGPRRREGLKLLRGFGSEIDEIVGLLRSAEPATRGVALLELFLIRVNGSVLDLGAQEEMREQLWRIRYLLSRGRASQDPDGDVGSKLSKPR